MDASTAAPIAQPDSADTVPADAPRGAHGDAPAGTAVGQSVGASATMPDATPLATGATPSGASAAPAAPDAQGTALAQGGPTPGPATADGARTWEGFLEFVAGKNGNGFVTGLAQARGAFSSGVLTLTCHNETHCGMMQNGDNNARLLRLVAEYFGPGASVALQCVEREPLKSDGLIQREMQAHPLVQRVRETFECRDPALVYPRGR